MLAWRPLLSVTTGLEKVRTKQGTKQDRVKKNTNYFQMNVFINCIFISWYSLGYKLF